MTRNQTEIDAETEIDAAAELDGELRRLGLLPDAMTPFANRFVDPPGTPGTNLHIRVLAGGLETLAHALDTEHEHHRDVWTRVDNLARSNHQLRDLLGLIADRYDLPEAILVAVAHVTRADYAAAAELF